MFTELNSRSSSKFSITFRQCRLAFVVVGVLFASALVGVGGLSTASAANSPKKITTCTNSKTGAIRLLAKGACNQKTERTLTWIPATSSTIGPDGKPFAYKIGDTGPGGGLIFFVDQNDEYPGFTYLEASPADLAGTFAWCSDTTSSIAGASGAPARSVGRGQANTIAMLAVCTSGAANAADEYANNSKTDWFLPSRDELKLMYANLPGAVGDFASVTYWSSSETNANWAWFQSFGYGGQYYDSKNNANGVRPVRAF